LPLCKHGVCDCPRGLPGFARRWVRSGWGAWWRPRRWTGRVSHLCACIGSPCLRQCVHGAPIGLAASGVLAIGGLYVLPYQQRALKRSFRENVGRLQAELDLAISAHLERELEASLGESLMCVHWVAVPEAMRARRANRAHARRDLALHALREHRAAPGAGAGRGSAPDAGAARGGAAQRRRRRRRRRRLLVALASKLHPRCV
jgi:hypothetical protein